ADDPAGALAAVSEVGRDHDPAAAADAHAGHPLVPALDDLPGPEAEAERLAPVPGGVELLAGPPRHAHVVDVDLVAGGGLGAVADLEVLGDQLGGRGLPGGHVHV